MTDENLDWITTVVLLPGIFYDILCICIYLTLSANLNDVMYCIYLLKLKWKETYWNWSGPPLCYSIGMWFFDSCNGFVFARISYKGCLRLAWCLWMQVIQMQRGGATVIMLQIWYENSQCPKCPMMKFDLNKFFSWIFTFGFTGKTPWTTTNYLYSLQNNVNQVWELPTVWLNRSWQTPLVQVGLAQGCHCHWVLLVS